MFESILPFLSLHSARARWRTTLILLACLATAPALAAAATFTVDSTSDVSDASPGDGACATGTGACTLRAAIEEVGALASDDDVQVPAGTYAIGGTALVPCNGGDCGRDTVTGADAATTIVDGGSATQVLTYYGPRLTLASLTIQHSSAAGIDANIIEIDDCAVIDNATDGVHIGSGSVELHDSTVAGNGAAGVRTDMASMTVVGTTVRENSVGLYANLGTVEVTDSLITKNSSGMEIVIPTVTISNTDITHNGAGIRHVGGDSGTHVTMTGGSISDNTAAGVAVDDGTIKLTGTALAGNGGCAVQCGSFGVAVEIADCSITNNLCGLKLPIGMHTGSATVVRTQIANNVGVGIEFGGNFFVSTTLTATDTTIDGNHGGGITAASFLNGFNEGPPIFVRLRNTTVSNNATTGSGGGMSLNSGTTLSAVDSTLSGNHADGTGGGIANAGTVALFNVTLVDNSADAGTGGIAIVGGTGTTSASHSILANNTGSGGAASDCSALASTGFNLIETTSGCTITGTTTGNVTGQDPALGPLADNGGETFTHALLPSSPAIDAGNPTGCRDEQAALLTTDQRGVLRPQNLLCDIGAYETTCGNGVVDDGETCDAGGPTDCCSADCQIVPDGSPCQDGNICTTLDACMSGSCTPGIPTPCGTCEACDMTRGCVAAPRPTCHAPTTRFSGQIQLTDKTKDTLAWAWSKGAATSLADYGDPVGAGDGYALCLYDESGATPTIAFRAKTRSGLCGSHPCWKHSGATALRYKDPTQTPDGLDSVLLKSGADGKAKILVSAKGPHLALPPLPIALPLRMQLQGPNGQCWEARYFALGSSRNDARQFKAKAFVP